MTTKTAVSATFSRELTLKADPAARTITGVAIPYADVAETRGERWRFEHGSIRTPVDLARVPLLLDHDPTRVVGVLVSLDDSDDALTATFHVPESPEGDALLALAAAGARSGLSVGVEIHNYDLAESGEYLVTLAELIEISSTAFPAFRESRLTSVRLHREDPIPMDTNSNAQTADVSAVTEAITAGFAALAAAAPAAPAPATPVVQVTEASPYRFDGIRGAHEFSSDILAASRGNGEAAQRLDTFMREAFTVTSSGVAAVNPTKQRPDLYVDHLVASTPVYSTLYKGSINDATPFAFPAFDSASNLVADHEEGVEPDAGSFAVKVGGTVQPVPVSGRVEIPREIIDAGGSPQVSQLIWTEMVRAYNAALEAKAAAFLLGVTPGSTETITAGAVDKALAAEIEAIIAKQHFVTGGLRVTDFLGHANLYLRATAARDDAGRPIYPAIGASNANGTQSSDFGAVQVGPLTLRPTWSLGALAADEVRKSYLLNRADLHVWASAPTRIDLTPTVANYGIGIFGYVASAATRASGVIAVGYNPTADEPED